MAGVILILGLIAAGIYTGTAWFYVAAGVLGGLYFLMMLCIGAFIKQTQNTVKKSFNDLDGDFFKGFKL